MKSLEVKAAEYVYASIADGYFSKEVKNGNEVIFVSGRYDRYDNEVVIDEAYLLNLETEESTDLDTFMDKEEFCKDFKKHGNSKIIREVHTRATNFELQCKHDNELFEEMAAFLIGKSRAYNDTDFRKMAVKLIGEKRVVLKTVEMGLPLWEYDNDYIIENLK